MREQLQLMNYSTSELAETTQGKPEGFEAVSKNKHLDGKVERSIFRERVFGPFAGSPNPNGYSCATHLAYFAPIDAHLFSGGYSLGLRAI